MVAIANTEVIPLICERCGREGQVGVVGHICPACGALYSNAQAGTLASPGKRLGASILDSVLWTFLWGIADMMGDFGILLGLALLALPFYFFAKSTSLGKMILGMKVYSTTGGELGFFKMLVRETIGKFISAVVLGLGYLWLLWDRDNQTWHDKIIGSVVLETVNPPATVSH